MCVWKSLINGAYRQQEVVKRMEDEVKRKVGKTSTNQQLQFHSYKASQNDFLFMVNFTKAMLPGERGL